MLSTPQQDAREPEFSRALTRPNDGMMPVEGNRYPNYDWMGTDGHEGTVDLQAYLRLLMRHWLVIVSAVLVCLAAGLAKTLLTTPLYDASATIQIDREAARVKDLSTFEAKDTGSPEEFFQTQYAVLKSRALAEMTAKDPDLGLALDPSVQKALGFGPGKHATIEQVESVLTDFISGHLVVAPVQHSRVVQLTIESTNAQASARIVNGIAQNFIHYALNRRVNASADGVKYLKEALDEQKTKLETSEKQLADYARSQQIVNVSQGGGVGAVAGGDTGISASSSGANSTLAANSLQAMQASLNGARASRIAAEQRYRLAQQSSPADVLTNPVIQSLKQQKTKLEQDYADKLGTYQPSYDPMLKLKAQIADIDKQIDTETKNIQTVGLAQVEREYKIALGQEQQLEAQVQRLTGSVLDLRTRSIQYDILQREADTSRQLYDALLQQYKEIGVSGHVEANNISILDRARVPGGPSKPQPTKNMMIAGLLGLVIGCALAFVIEYLDESIRSPEDVEKKLGLPLLGSIPKLEKGTDPATALADIRSPFSEAYYSVRTALQFSTNTGVPSSLVVTSARPSEGKSTSATALAKNFARLGVRVLLIDSDMRNPSLHRVFGVENTQGLSNYLTGGLKLHSLAQPTDTPNLFFIPCGPLPPNPAELLGGSKILEMYNEAREFFDMVLIDAPPVMGLADAPLLASSAGGTVLVVEAGSTGRHLAKASIRRLSVGNARLLGILLTKFDARKSSYGYGYGYGYGYSYEYGSRPPQIKGAA